MKKIFGVICTVMLLMTACVTKQDNKKQENQDDFIWAIDKVSVDMYAPVGEQRGFNVHFAYREGKENISLLELIGENIDAIEVSVIDDTFESLNKIEIDGYKLGYLGIIFKLKENSEVIINEMKINIDSKIETIVFKNPLIIRPYENSEDIYELMSTDVVGGKKNALTYVVSNLEGATVIDYGLVGSYIETESRTYIDKVEMELNDRILNKDSQVKFSIEYEVADENVNSGMLGNFFFKYLNKEGNECIYYFTIVQQGVGNEENGIIALKELLGIETE